ncbi:MAG: hypothetical protein HY243_15920 [Proteobacteria bacterium]|nr:hypothetical protein [Pseudomonadota bacterium]
MTEALAARREYEQTESAFAKVRTAMVERLFKTPVGAGEERERLYMSVQTLDAVREALMTAMTTGEIEQYVEEIAAGGKS